MYIATRPFCAIEMAIAARHSLTQRVLMKELGKITNWYEFGIALDVPVEELDSIRRSNQNAGTGECKIAMFQRWLDRTRTASWNDIIHALKEVGHHALADELTSKYIQQPQQSAVAPQSPDEVRTDRRVLLKLLNLQTCYGQMIAKILALSSEVDLGHVKIFLEVTIGDRGFRDCLSFMDVLHLLIDKHIDIFNITRLEQLSNEINENAMKELVANYNEEKEKFLSEVAVVDFHREVASKVNYKVPYGEKAEVVIRIPREYASPHERTLQDMETLAGKAFGEYYQSFIRMTVKPGSILVVWQFPVSLSAKLEDSARDSSDLFAKEGVEVVMVAGRVVFTKYRFPLEQILDMKNADEQIGELRHNLAKKENQMSQREKEMREELLNKEKELRDRLVKKDLEWMEKFEQLRSQLRKRDTKFIKKLKTDQASIKMAEHYWMATVILIVVIIACIGIVYHQQMEVTNCRGSLNELRNKIEYLVEQRGKCEELSKHALTLKELSDKLLNWMFSNTDRIMKDAEECQILLQQLAQNVTVLAAW